MKKPVLIAYFSRAGNNYVNGQIVNLLVGNTEYAAKMIQGMTGGELFVINPIHTYSEDYTTCTEEAKQELQADARPKLMDSLKSIDEFETIVLCYPNWWGTMPMPVWTFLEGHDFSGKTILPICTHEGGGMGASERDIKKLCAHATIGKGLAIHEKKVPVGCG